MINVPIDLTTLHLCPLSITSGYVIIQEFSFKDIALTAKSIL